MLIKSVLATGLLALAASAAAQAPAALQPVPLRGELVHGPSLTLALQAALAAIDACKAADYPVGVAIVDENGNMRVNLAADGATKEGPNGARRKAILSALQKASGAEIVARLATDKALAAEIRANHDWLARAGSLLIKVDGRIVGAIGVEGLPHDTEKDTRCAQAGIDKIKSRLR